jgi:ComF family protein
VFSGIRTFLLDLLFPPICVVCQKDGAWMCARCEPLIPRTLHTGGALSLESFEAPWVSRAIHSVKYGGVREVATLFGALLAARFPPIAPEEAIVTAIPIHESRERERGFNQSEWIARSFAGSLSLRYFTLLERTRRTETQTALTHEQRQANVADAFRIHRGIPLDMRTRLVFSSKTIILIDDVVTTGATLFAAEKELRRCGARRVVQLTVAYAPLHEGG